VAAADKVRALDATPAASAVDASTVAIATTAYAQSSPSFGVSFTAPTSGRVRVSFRARFECKVNSSRCTVSAEVAVGATVGSGSVLFAGDDNEALETSQSSTAATTPAETRIDAMQWRTITGLTAGNSYNAYIVHKGFVVTGGTIYARGILVEPLP
jgi:hypothetical protein